MHVNVLVLRGLSIFYYTFKKELDSKSEQVFCRLTITNQKALLKLGVVYKGKRGDVICRTKQVEGMLSSNSLQTEVTCELHFSANLLDSSS